MSQRAQDSRWAVPRQNITPDPRSRFFDPHDPDRPPLPPDDPTVNQFMRTAYGMRGSKRWGEVGETDTVENPFWPTYLGGAPIQGPRFELPKIKKLGLKESIELGLIHSREYQEQLENVYLSALSLTFERYRFDVRPLGFLGEPGTGLAYEHQPDDASQLRLGTSSLGMSKLLPAGGQLVAELTNNTLWLFGGPNQTRSASTLAFSLVQPMMLGARREIAMEDLTQSERNVIYSVRDFARFRKDFYTTIVTGARALPLPGSASGGSELAFLIRGERSPTVGFYFLLFQLQRVRNQQINVHGLDSLIRELSRLGEAGRATALDITQLKSSLAISRRRLALVERRYFDELDRFKVQLGLPPDQPVEFDDSLLDQFRFLNAEILELERQIDEVQLTSSPAQWREAADAFARLHGEVVKHSKVLDGELKTLDARLPLRLREFNETEAADALEDFQQAKMQFAAVEGRTKKLAEQLDDLRRRAAEAEGLNEEQKDKLLGELRQTRRDLVRTTREMLGLQIGVRVDLFEVARVGLNQDEVVDVALEQRLDLMNRRGVVMDARRQIEIAADQLEATFNIVGQGEVNTKPLLDNNNPLDFRAKDSSFRAGIEFVTPIDRRAARNNFRAAQIAYQRARRNYMAAEDQVKLDVRSQLREVRAQAKVLEINRRALRIAARELDQAVEFSERPDAEGRAGSRGLNISRALDNILEAQDELIESWVDYQTARLSLFRDIGTMFIDENGFWIEQQPTKELERLPPPL